MPTTKTGEKISWNEYFSRWKVGIQQLTPQQRLENETRATTINFIGYLAGIIILIWQHGKLGWLSWAILLIFIGSAYSTLIKIIGYQQQKKFFRNLEEQMEGGNKDD